MEQNPLEKQLIQDKQEILEKRKQVEELTEIQFVPGFEDKVGLFPKLEGLEGKPVLARFSYGKEAPNMSSVFLDPITQTARMGEENTKDFLESQGFTGQLIQVLGKFGEGALQIEEVDRDTIKEQGKVEKIVGNYVFTRDPEVTLFIKPADCPVAVIYCKDEHGNPLVVIDHSGADATNAGITRQGVWALKNILGVDLNTAQVSIFPGVSQDNFFITKEWEANGQIKKRENGIPKMNWGDFIKPLDSTNPREKRFVDITSALEMQLIEGGIPPANIQAYRRDTYEDARNGLAFSRRFSGENQDKNGNRARDGGQILAVQLKI